MSQKHRWNSSGYDAEEHYFEKLNRELIQKIQASGGKEEQSSQNSKEQGSEGGKVLAFPKRQTETQKKAA